LTNVVGTGFPAEVLSLAGIDPAAYRPATLERRHAASLRAARAGTVEDARRALARDPRTFDRVLDSVLIGVTGLFRDDLVFEYVWGLLAECRGGIRVWSAGCANGAELYSVGILLAEKGRLEGADLVGTDARAGAIESARAGEFPVSALDDMPSHRKAWFDSRGTVCRVADAIRARTRWRRADVLRDVEPGPFDVVLCRNLAIYLTPIAAGGVFRRLAGALRPGGLLVVGKAERVVEDGMVRIGANVFRKTGGCR
jgi:chemotaxis protein methyltransferase CheR